MLLAVEFTQAIEAGYGHIAHDFTDDRFALVSQLDVFHAGPGHLGHRLYAFDILGPDFGHPTAIGIVNPAGTPGADADKGGFGRAGDVIEAATKMINIAKLMRFISESSRHDFQIY